ncbi:MAG: hypothetical protein C4563_01675 [Desulfobulbus sp.]|nr:MAG: hypothetical protein C4563_01675 [Desulfobulbus sp.]
MLGKEGLVDDAFIRMIMQWRHNSGFSVHNQVREQARNIPSSRFRPAFDKARARAGLPGLHMHDLRHTAASHMLMAGTDLRTLASILGHSTLQMVLRYTHLLDEHKLNAVDRLNSFGIR